MSEALQISESGARLSEVIQASVAEATIEMFADQGVSGVDAFGSNERFLTDQSTAAVIGFTSDAVRGSMVINVDTSMAIATRPVELGPISADDVDAIQDWTGELSNQLLGRAKNKVVRYGELLAMSTPMALSARDLQWKPGNATHKFQMFFESSSGRLLVLVAMSVDDDRTLCLQSNDEDSAAEGDLVLF